MKSDIKLSVIIPTYNRGHCIGDALESILRQEPAPFEIIVVDDGSTDDTRQVLSNYIDRVKVVLQENAGVSAARNSGVRFASGDWIAFLDSDDVWLPERVRMLFQDLDRFSEFEPVLHVADIVFSGDGYRESLFELRGWSEGPEVLQDSDLSFGRALKGFSLCSSAVRREVAISVGGFPGAIDLGEDIYFLAASATHGSVIFDGFCAAEARRLEDGSSGAIDAFGLDPVNSLGSLEHMYGLLRGVGLSRGQDRQLGRVRSANLYNLARAQSLRNFGTYRRTLFRSIMVHPNPFRALIRALPPFILGRVGWSLISQRSSFSRLRS